MLQDRKFARETITKNIGKKCNKRKYGDKSNHSCHWTTLIFELSILEGNDTESLSNSYPWQCDSDRLYAHNICSILSL